MKEFIKKWLLLTVMMIYAAFIIPVLWNGRLSEESVFLLEILLLSVLLCLVQVFTHRWKLQWYLLELVVEYIGVLILVGAFGYAAGWFTPSSLWMVFCYVTPVYVIGYFLDLARTRRDLELINAKIRQRREAAEKGELHETGSHSDEESV